MLLLQNINPIRVNVGGTVKVYGSGFDSRCWVRVGSQYLSVLDYDANSLEFAAPYESGNFTVTVGQSATVAGEFPITVVELRESNTWNLPVRTADDFRCALLGLMPRGFAWFLGKNGNWYKLFSAFAAVVYVVYTMLRMLVKNGSPATTTAYSEWERELNLPVKGLEADTDDGRLNEIYRVARKMPSDTVPFYKSLAALFGRDVKIYECYKNPEPFAAVNFGSDDPNFYWMVEQTATDDDWHICDCNDTCNDYLGWWWNPVLESYFETMKPAHTKCLYTYKLPEILCVMTEDDDFIMTEDGDYIITEGNAYTPNVGTVEIGGRTYKTVTIGNATWLAENLDYKFTGCDISTSEDPIAWNVTDPSAWYYDNDETTYGIDGEKKCGLLYNWYAVDYLEQHKDILIPGWHVPTSEEWDSLADAVGGYSVAGLKLKAVDGSVGDSWPSNFGGTDAFGFAALPGGDFGVYFGGIGTKAEFWTNDGYGEGPYANGRDMYGSSNAMAVVSIDYKTCGRSVRLVKDY